MSKLKAHWGESNPMCGKTHTEETKNKIRNTKRNNFLLKYADKIEDIVNMYKQGLTIKNIADIIGSHNRAVKKILEHRKIRVRGQGSRYLVDDNFFENIDSERKAYWLGMIATDGTIRKNKNRNEVVLSLKISDAEHIKNFINDISSTSKIHFVNRGGSEQAYASIASKKIKEDLIKLGITPNKTFTVSPPNIKSDMERHFWRGCVDGDGCIYKAKSGRYRIDFIGTHGMVSGFRDFIKKNTLINDRKIFIKGNIFGISYHKQEDVRKIAELLYGDSSVKLNRKYILANQIILGDNNVKN